MGNTALLAATLGGQLAVVKYLISKGADFGARNGSGFTAIDMAEVGRNPDVYEFLKSIQAKQELADFLLQSAAKGKLHLIKDAVAAGVAVDIQSDDGFTLLIAASSYGQLNVVKWLIEHKADPNTVANNGVTALYVAVKYRYRKVVEYLLDHGSQIRHPKQPHSVISLARSSGDQAILKLLTDKEQREADEKRLARAYSEAIETLEKYRSIKAGMLTTDETDSVINGVAKLMSIKAEWIKQLGDDSFDPICLRIILGGRWQPSSVEDEGRKGTDYTPLMMACQFWRPKDIDSLVSDGADVNECNGIGETALIALTKTNLPGLSKERIRDFTDSAEALLRARANINSVDIAGWTPLMWAAFNGDKQLVKFLVDKGADTKVASKSGATALSIAQSLGYENTAAIIKAASR
jgi:serine/threonine-protein phosphatase 6 regulatory ankyrin repeat subunit B